MHNNNYHFDTNNFNSIVTLKKLANLYCTVNRYQKQYFESHMQVIHMNVIVELTKIQC